MKEQEHKAQMAQVRQSIEQATALAQAADTRSKAKMAKQQEADTREERERAAAATNEEIRAEVEAREQAKREEEERIMGGTRVFGAWK